MVLSMFYMKLRKKIKGSLYMKHLHAYNTDQGPSKYLKTLEVTGKNIRSHLTTGLAT